MTYILSRVTHGTDLYLSCVVADELTRVPLSSRLYRSRPVPAAYYVDGYQKARAFIVTERPATAATDALWRIAWEQGVTGIVLIGTLEVRRTR